MTDLFRIHEIGAQGDGIHRAADELMFIEGALPGDVVRAELRRGPDGVLRGAVTEIVEASPHRTAAPCPHYEVCGGCTLQHADETFYRAWKTAIVRDALAKKGLEPRVWNTPVFVAPGSRRRVTFAASKKNNVVALGFYRRRTHTVTAIETCLIAEPAMMDLRARLIPLLVPVLQEGKTADVFIQLAGGTAEVAITGPIGRKGKPDLNLHEAVAQLVQKAAIARVSWRPREQTPLEVMLEARPLLATFGALAVALPPLAFLQPTIAGEDALARAVMDALPARGKFADLFAGCGTFAGRMLGRGSVDAYESGDAAVRALDKAKAQLPLTTIRRDLFRNPLSAKEAQIYDAIVFDPPRAGAHDQAKQLAESKVQRLIGVSCNPATFARDARIIVEGGYVLDAVTVVDQFTWSHHVELIGVFSKGR